MPRRCGRCWWRAPWNNGPNSGAPLSESQDPVLNDLKARVERLEAEVARLGQASKASARTGEMPLPAPSPRLPTPPPLPRPLPKPKAPSKPFNATVLVAALGAGIILLCAIFVLNLAIQRGWIGPELRVLLGLAAGGIFSAVGARQLLSGNRGMGVSMLLAGLGILLFTFWAGAKRYALYPMQLGFVGVAATALVAGGLAARAKSQGTLAVALVCAFLAPPIFSTGGHHEVSLTIYTLVLVGATALVPYLAGIGARWGFARWLVVVWTWLYLAVAAADHLREDAGILALLSLAHLALAGIWIWLPKQAEPRPSSPTLLWFSVSLAAMGLTARYWRTLDWPTPWLAFPTLGFASLNLAMVKPLRARLGSRQADLGLLVLAGGFLALAVPIALEWRWVGPLWGAFALGLAWAAGRAEGLPDWDEEEARNLLRLAVGMGLLATFRWFFSSSDHWHWDRAVHSSSQYMFTSTPFLNGRFVLCGLTVSTWLLLARRGGPIGVGSFFLAEVIANLGLASEVAYLMLWLGHGGRAASVAITLVWVLSGVAQWLASLKVAESGRQSALSWTGLVVLAGGILKLIAVDMARADAVLRVLAFLVVGLLLVGAAFISQKARAGRSEEVP